MDTNQLQESLKFIDSWLDFQYKRGERPGFAIAISYKGKVIFNNAYGYTNLETKEKLTPNHIFRIASHSKTFTATAIMQLVEKKRLKLDDYVANWLPWLAKHKDKRFQKVTILQLLSHTAGVIRDGLDADYWNLIRAFPDKEKFKQEILEADLIFDTNTRLKYSNFGFTLLGLITEEVSGETYNNYVLENIIRPLGLKNTGTEYIDEIKDKLTVGYTRQDTDKTRLPFKNIDTKAMSSATGFYSTGADLCKYFSAQMVGTGQLLTDESKREMQKTRWKVKNSKEKEGYGLGFVSYKIGERQLFGHSGGFPGQSTNSMYDPQDKLVVVVLTNCIDGNAKAITKGIVSVISEFEKNTEKDSAHDLSKFEGRYMNTWSIVNILAVGNRLLAVDPMEWEPFEEAEKLKYVNSKTLKIVKAHSFNSEGELIHFKFSQQGKVESIIYAGSTMLPEEKYISEQKRLKK